MINLREAGSGDISFLWELHVASMRDYVDATYGWNDTDQKDRFDAEFRPAGIQIIEMDGKLIGMWEINQQTDPWFLARIAIIPAYQNKGIGSSLIAEFLADADSQERQVALQVLKVNPAKALYERFGFLTYEETDTHFKMLRRPDLNPDPTSRKRRRSQPGISGWATFDIMQEKSMDVSCVVIELKPGSLGRVKEWAAFMLDNREEALATLENEEVTIESFFLLTMESKDYLVGYMRAKSMEHAHEAVKHSLSQVDAYHQQFKKDAWAGGIRAELLFDLSRIQDESSFA